MSKADEGYPASVSISLEKGVSYALAELAMSMPATCDGSRPRKMVVRFVDWEPVSPGVRVYPSASVGANQE